MTNETNPGTVEVTPCPFCGGDELGHGYEMAGSYFAGNVQCYTCNAYIVADSEADAIAAWNTRAAQSQPAATGQEVGREAQQKTVAQAVANIVGAPYDDWRHFTNEADAILARLAALTAEPAAKAGDGGKYPGLPMSDADLTKHYEASKHDVVGLVGSEVRQIIGELRHYRANPPSPQPDMGSDEAVRPVHARRIVDTVTEFCRGADFSCDMKAATKAIMPLLNSLAALSPPASQSVEKMKEADILSILSRHKLGGPWVQYRQEMPFAADCGCGEAFFAKSEGDARSAWEAHVAHYLTLPHKEEATPATTTTERGRG